MSRALLMVALALAGCTDKKKPATDADMPPAAKATPDREGGVLAHFQKARVDTACNEVRRLGSAVQLYQLSEGGKCPPSLQTLEDERLIDILHPDPWKHPFELTCTDGVFAIRSLGADGEPNTEDDVFWVKGSEGCKHP